MNKLIQKNTRGTHRLKFETAVNDVAMQSWVRISR
jgi:hypothetical protein